ncbi:hypothetical protein [Fluviicola sp.]|uniref:hypothetical protein n=1 Tax=Fluviicola sp. TaxID=1917219 RepID=UPI003D2BE0E0
MKRLTTFLFVLCISFVQAQSFDHIVYKQEVNQAYMLAVKDAKYTESLQKLEAVKKKYGMLYGEDYRLQSYCYKKLGNDSLAAISLKTCWSVPSFDMRTLWYVEELQPDKLMEGFNEYENQLVNEGFENSAKIRPKNADSLIAVIDSLTYWDKFYRNQWHTNPDNKQFQDQLDLMNRVNEKLLEDMVRRIGFPGEKRLQLGEFCIWYVLVHSVGNEEFYQRMKPVFLNEVKIGNMSPWMYARWVDQHQFYYKLPSIYQTLTDHPFMNTEKERKQISKNRREIGLVDLDFSLPKF